MPLPVCRNNRNGGFPTSVGTQKIAKRRYMTTKSEPSPPRDCKAGFRKPATALFRGILRNMREGRLHATPPSQETGEVRNLV
jgi:hypothetical protein